MIRGLVVLAVLVVLFGCDSPNDCKVGDFSERSPVDDASLERFGLAWIKNAKMCSVGEYLVFTPASSDSHNLWVIRADGEPSYPVAMVGVDTITVFQPGTQLLAQFGNQDESGIYRSMSYEAFDVQKSASVSIFDFDLDGQIDARSLYYRDTGTLQYQHRIADEWQDLVEQDGRFGYLIDGQFQPMKEGRELLIDRANRLRR